MKLVIDLSKGRPKGSTNKDHKWIARYTNAKGEIVRVYPDKRHGVMTDKEQLKLHPGVSINQVVSDVMIGGPTGETKRDGRPSVREGEFVRYEVAHESELRDPRNRENYTRDAISREKVGQYHVFGYPKVHAIERDEKEKPVRFAGYTHIEYHPSVRAHGYRTPKKIETFKVEPHEIKTTEEQAPQRGFNAAELPLHGDRGPQRIAGGSVSGRGPVAPPHTKKEHDFSMESIARREQIENMRLDEQVDPLSFAAKLYDKAALKAKEKATPGARSVLEFQDWQLAKYHDRQELMDKLQKQPVGALISLGYAKPTATSRKLNEALIAEWTPIIMGLSGDNFAAFKETDDYRAAAARDAERTKRGLQRNKGGTDSRKYVNAYKRTVVSDLFQAGAEKLLRIARQYEVDTENPRHRFDKLAYASVANEIRKQSRIKAEEAGLLVPVKHEGEIEQAMRENARGGGSMEPLSPHEAAELKQVTPVARTALAEIMPKLPDAYRRVVEARLWLDEPSDGGVPLLDAPQSRAETMTRKQRHEKLDEKIAEAEERGETVARDRRKPRSWEREWTGFGSIADKYQTWIDPETGTSFNIDEYSVGHQREVLQNYYRMGVAHIIRELSVPVTRTKPGKHDAPVSHPRAFQPSAEWKQRENHVIVPLTNKEIARLSPEEQLTYTAVGGEPRVLTQQGKAVKRYLQIETKLATQNRRRWMAPGHQREVDTSTVSIEKLKKPRAVGWKIEHTSPLENQAVRFFTSSANQALAGRLGMHDLHEYAQQVHQQNVSPGTYAENLYRRARKHYKVFHEVNNMTDKQLDREHSQHARRVQVLQSKLRTVKDDDTHKRILHDISVSEGRVHIMDFVRQTRGTTKSMVVTKKDTPLSLIKAFLDYDFELDRLGVEMN